MKKLALVSLLLLAACGGRASTPAVPGVSPVEVVDHDRLVPVLCEEVVVLVDPDSDGLTTEMLLEEKAYRLLRSDAQQRANISKLEAAALRCGVKVTHKAQ